METKCYYIHALTALHAGTGQGTGVIDLPIAREKSTGLPIVPGSGIKGVLREELQPEESADKTKNNQWEALFGPASAVAQQNNGFAGALTIQDAQLLCLPVRSIYGVFAWVTCPFILERYQRDFVHMQGTSFPKIPSAPEEQAALITTNSQLATGTGDKTFLEDLDFQVTKGVDEIDSLAQHIAKSVFPDDETWQPAFTDRFMVVSDNVFSFLADTATEVRARIKLKPGTRTVQKGALWYEENLPAETILWGIIGCDRSRSLEYPKAAIDLMHELINEFIPEAEKRLQVGGNATVGRGNIRYILNMNEG